MVVIGPGLVRSFRVVAVGVVAVLGMTSVSACTHDVNCSTATSGPSGVGVLYSSVVAAHLGARLVATLCVNGECKTRRIDKKFADGFSTGEHTVHDATPVKVTLSIKTQSGQPVFRGTTTVKPTMLQGGGGCPETWAGVAVAKGAHRLVARHLTRTGQ